MNRNKRITILSIVLLVLIIIFFIFYFSNKSQAYNHLNQKNKVGEEEIEEKIAVKEPDYYRKMIEIESGDTFSKAAKRAGVLNTICNSIYNESKEIYDLAKIRAGYFLEFKFDKKTDKLEEMIYKMDSEEELFVNFEKDPLEVKIRKIPYETKVVTSGGKVESSLYEAAMSQDIDERAIIAMADAFQWSIDFAKDPRKGDTFKFIYEKLYLDGEYVRPGKVLAARYVNAGEPYELYYFEENEENKGYFDKEANSVQKMFLKAPLSFKYISSGFTTGSRYVAAFNVSTGHRAIDYAAITGTPIRTVGDGTISFAGWNGPYGYMVKVRHNGTYSTNYGHMSKIAVRTGQKIKQGDVIGYVGSTGFSTGPHLHYEMVKNGSKINPLNEVLPPGKPIKEENKERFFNEINDYQEKLRK
ncbi:MAG: peptidoglycan DD-metalloendopeptidase family protein [Patescibacteria group bacterium]|jgi:murein DD-endopeptidase MepM/ murein hydrolase activator NlpD|nr:peptidoglycan DD-metalloendopeptidase family protein [Patescibacteria group bacterium]